MDVRPLAEADLGAAAEVDFAALQALALRHGASPAMPAVRDSRARIRRLFDSDPLGGFGAWDGDGLVGYAWVNARGPLVTIGSLAVEPGRQREGIGRALLEQCLATAGTRAAQVRLVHDGLDVAALGLFLSVGFRVVAPLIELELAPGTTVAPGSGSARALVRAASTEDVQRLVARDARAFGTTRPRDVERCLRYGPGLVAERAGGLVGYALQSPGRLGPAAADEAELVVAMLAGLVAVPPRPHALEVLALATDRVLVDGLLRLGFRILRIRSYMVRGGGTAPPSGTVLMSAEYA
jgi:predicted N-acetyltransferase YhbS